LSTFPTNKAPRNVTAGAHEVRAYDGWLDAVAGLALANLVCFRSWGLLLQSHRVSAYWLKTEPTPTSLGAAMANVLLLGLLFFLVLRWARRLEFRPSGWRRLVLRTLVGLVGYSIAGALILSAYAWLQETPLARDLGAMNLWLLAFAMLAVGYFSIAYWIGERRPFRIALVLLTMISPLVALTFAQAILRIVTYDPAYLSDKPTAPRLAAPLSAPQVLWLVFDEWDEALTFAERPSGLELPEIDRLRRQTFYSETVSSPVPEQTGRCRL
jgi:hypothetical protein